MTLPHSPAFNPIPLECCPQCGCELEYDDCWNGCDEGYFDGYEEDPLWYDPGDMYPCDVCRGQGYVRYCPNWESGHEED